MRIKSVVLGFLFFTVVHTAFGVEDEDLTRADSLFQSQKYTEAFAVYKAIMTEGNVSASMLLRMAFIQDASGNYAEALYYLDQYYKTSADRQAVGKIEEISGEYELNGYRYSDTDYFLALFGRYRFQILMVLLAISVLLVAYVYRKSKSGEKAYAAAVIQLFTTTLLLLALNFQPPQSGIITDDLTLLRSGPSAGAEPVEILLKGHKVRVLDQLDVWTRILWDGEEAFVRNNRLRLI